MKVVFDPLFYTVYTSDPASVAGRMEAIMASLPTDTDVIPTEPANIEQLELAHTTDHIRDIKREGLYEIASLAAGAAIKTARIGLKEPCFGMIRPPGHHASAESAWGFCFFNNMAVSLLTLKSESKINTALVLDVDLHYGDGTENILGPFSWVSIHNPEKNDRVQYINEVQRILSSNRPDIIGISAGFDNHKEDWGGLLSTEDYFFIGQMVKKAANSCGAGYFALLEGGYNHKVLGQNAAALMNGMTT